MTCIRDQKILFARTEKYTGRQFKKKIRCAWRFAFTIGRVRRTAVRFIWPRLRPGDDDTRAQRGRVERLKTLGRRRDFRFFPDIFLINNNNTAPVRKINVAIENFIAVPTPIPWCMTVWYVLYITPLLQDAVIKFSRTRAMYFYYDRLLPPGHWLLRRLESNRSRNRNFRI